MTWTIGIDIGGTFTDCMCTSGGESFWGKAPSTWPDASVGVIGALDEMARRAGLPRQELLRDTNAIVHGCTIGTNAVIERNGARVALLVTAGHEDVLRIGRLFQKVAGLAFSEISHTSRLTRPRPLVDHRLTFGVDERLDRQGRVLAPLADAQIEALAERLRDEGVESVAVCFLWSFVDPAHERRTRDILAARLPGVEITLSSDIAPVIGEYERAVATVLNAYVSPSLRRYLEPLEDQLRADGLRTRLQVFHSGGGVTSVRGALGAGIRTIDSGPVGGVVGAQALGRRLDRPNLICADMGGTSLDVAVIWDGHIEEEAQPTIDQYTFSVPRVSVSSIGAGGGSVAWVDEAGVLRVGPRSARAVPGPACYGRGGTEPTVTDANVVLGALSRESLLGGEMPIDHDAAVAAFGPLCERLGADLATVAKAVLNLVNAQMADLVRRTTLERGFDPRDFTLVVYGGAGPAHGIAIAEEVGCASVLFPDMASVFAAGGMASCDALYAAERFLDIRSPFGAGALAEIRRVAGDLSSSVQSEFREDGQDPDRVDFRSQIAMRYQGQVSELPVDIGWLSQNGDRNLVDEFAGLYGRTYGHGAVVDDAPVAVARIRVEGRIPRLSQVASNGGAHGRTPTPTRTREVMFPNEEVTRDVPIIDMHGSMREAAGARLTGPVIVERYGETIVIPDGRAADVMDDGSLLVELGGA